MLASDRTITGITEDEAFRVVYSATTGNILPSVRRLKSLTSSLAAAVAAALLPLAVHAQALNPDVRPDNIHSTICVAGWAKTVRPPVAYTNGIKRKLVREQGIAPSHISEYELDHVVPLALGGAPRSPANLKLQPLEGPDGAKKKDRIEVKLQCLVCSGKVPLSMAQREIGEDWQAAHRKYSRVKCQGRSPWPTTISRAPFDSGSRSTTTTDTDGVYYIR